MKRLFVRAKSNNGPDGGGYHYQIEQVELTNYKGMFSSQVVWGDPVEGSARDLLIDTNEQTNPDERSMLEEAIEFLKVLLSDGPVSKKEIDERAKDMGFKGVTLRRAKAFLGVEAVHDGYGKGSIWKWYLPSKVIKSDQR